MISGPARSGSLYWLTSVPQTPAISTFINAASGGMSGRSNSRSSVVDAAVFNAASTFSGTRTLLTASVGTYECTPSLGPVSRGRGGAAPLQRRVEQRVGLPDVAVEDLAAVVIGQPVQSDEPRLVSVHNTSAHAIACRHLA